MSAARRYARELACGLRLRGVLDDELQAYSLLMPCRNSRNIKRSLHYPLPETSLSRASCELLIRVNTFSVTRPVSTMDADGDRP